MKFSCRRILLAVILAVVPASASAAPSMGGLLIAEIGPDGTIYVSGEEQNYGGPRTGVIYTVVPPYTAEIFAISEYLRVPCKW